MAAILTPPSAVGWRRPRSEFVNPDEASRLGSEFARLQASSDLAKIDSWFVMQAIADQVGENSNVGVRGISWSKKSANAGAYAIQVTGANGQRRRASNAAPGSLPEAQSSPLLGRAVEKMDAIAAELGGYCRASRPMGTSYALVDALEMSATGREWVAARSQARALLLRMVQIADSYGREGVYLPASMNAHYYLLEFDGRVALIRQYPTVEAARAKSVALRHGTDRPRAEYLTRPTPAMVAKVAARSGVDPSEARVILRAVLNGRSKTRLVRAVNESLKIIGE